MHVIICAWCLLQALPSVCDVLKIHGLWDVECQHKVFLDAAHEMSYGTYELGIRFDLKPCEIKVIEENYPQSITRQRSEVFDAWQKSKQAPNYGTFFTNLSQCRPPDKQFMKRVCDMVLRQHGFADGMTLPNDIDDFHLRQSVHANNNHIGTLINDSRRSKQEVKLELNNFFDHLVDLATCAVEKDKEIETLKAGMKRLRRDLDCERKKRRASDEQLAELKGKLKLSCGEVDTCIQAS